MSRKTAQVSGGDTGTAPQYNFLRDEARASSWLLAYGDTTTSTLKVLINEGVVYFGGTKVEFAGGYSPLMTEPAASSRIDVISMTSAGVIAVTAGTEADTPTAPALPTNNVPICEVYHKAGEVKITDTDEDAGEGYINKDLRRTFFLPNTHIVSENLRNSNDAEKSTAATAYVKLKEISLSRSLSACTIKFTLKTTLGDSTAYGRIYKNGVAEGTAQSTASSDGEEFSEDFADFVVDDLIQIYIYSSTETRSAYVKNMRIYYDEVIQTTIIPTVNQDP